MPNFNQGSQNPPRRRMGPPGSQQASQQPVGRYNRQAPPANAGSDGWAKVVQRQAQSEARKNANQNKPEYLKLANKFYLNGGDESMIQILNDDPVCVDGARIPPSFDYYVSRKDVDRSCPLVDAGLKLSFAAGFKVLDHRGEYDKVKKEYKFDGPIERYWLTSQTVATQLNALRQRKGIPLSEMVLIVSRSGSDKNNTVYNFEQAIDANNKVVAPITDWVEELPSMEEALIPMSRQDLEMILDGYDASAAPPPQAAGRGQRRQTGNPGGGRAAAPAPRGRGNAGGGYGPPAGRGRNQGQQDSYYANDDLPY